MNIEWYPGHVAKARREIKEHIKDIDIVIEIIDARCPLSSINFLNEEIKGKKSLVVVNKIDLVDKNSLKDLDKKILDKKASDGLCDKTDIEIIYLDSRNNDIKRIVDKKINLLCKKVYERNELKGIKNTVIKTMVVGMPNVGKSTFINSYVRKRVNKVENTPGVTKNLQWAKISENVLLLDTPGVTVKKFENSDVGINLALVGSINDNIIVKQDLVYEFIKKCFSKFSNLFIDRYKLKQVSEQSEAIEVFDEIAKNNRFVKTNGNIDYERTANLIINDFRSGRLGKISLEF